MMWGGYIRCEFCSEQVPDWRTPGPTSQVDSDIVRILFSRDQHHVWCPVILDREGRLTEAEDLLRNTNAMLLANEGSWRRFGSQVGRYPGKRETLDRLQGERRAFLRSAGSVLGLDPNLHAQEAERVMEGPVKTWACVQGLEVAS